MKSKFLLLPLAVALCASIPLSARGRDDDDHRHHQYDKRHKDYHDFDEHEDRAWHKYWEQRHHGFIDWDRASEKQRQDYWHWRHSHSDAILHIDIR